MRKVLPDQRIISDATLSTVPHRRTRRNVVVLKFGGTTAGATKDEGRIKLARKTIADLIDGGHWVVPVFSAFRRGRSSSQEKVSITDLLQNYKKNILAAADFWDGVEKFAGQLTDVHLGLMDDLELRENEQLAAEIERDINVLKNTAAMCCSAHEDVPSLNDYIVTAGERLVVKILSAYFNNLHAEGKFPVQTAPATAMELGIYTNNDFGSASILWARAVEHAREVVLGKYLEQNVMPVVTGFDGIYDPQNEFREIMQSPHGEDVDRQYSGVYRTSLGRGGSDLTATFLGLALDAEYVGFCKETPGVLTGDDMLVGKAATTIQKLDYDLATEAGNIYSRAVEPVRAGNVPVHIFDPARPDERTVISDVHLDDGLYIVERPIETVNVHVGTIPDEPGELREFLGVFARNGVNVEEVRHQRSGTDSIVIGDEKSIQGAMAELNDLSLRPVAQYTWYLRVIGNITEELAAHFNDFMHEFGPLSLASYQVGTKVLTATVARNRAGRQIDEVERIEDVVRKIHDELIVPALVERQRPVPAR